jgi:hypothetical protein
MPKRTTFTSEHFVLCEGEEDAAFARAVAAGRNPKLFFDVSPNVDVGNIGGNTGFEASFLALEPIAGFNQVKHVVILADNDENPTRSFNSIIKSLAALRASNAIHRQWGEATQAGAQFGGDRSVAVWMWPAPGEKGCLETLLWRAVKKRHPKEAECAEAACHCSGADRWPVSKFYKALVRCFLSLTCKRNPAISLSTLWRDAANLIPISDLAFKAFADFLQTAQSQGAGQTSTTVPPA